MLLQEEQYIIHWLTEYGPLPKAQIVRMLKDKPPKTAEKIIRALKNEVMLHEISGGYYLGGGPHVPAGSAHDPCRMGVAAVH